MSMSARPTYRDDARWQKAQAMYIQPGHHLTASARACARRYAIGQMYEIENEYEPCRRVTT